ncbi:MAG: transglutaminase domain-containing protein [Clostridia bacterium]|nr:transglutaminase domain-containing protein [Clostridia bacterium]
MNVILKNLTKHLGNGIASALYAVGIITMFVHAGEANPNSAYVFASAFTSALLFILLASGGAVRIVTVLAIEAAAAASVLSGLKPLMLFESMYNALSAGDISGSINEFACVGAILLTLVSFLISDEPHSAYLLGFLTLIAAAAAWFSGFSIVLKYSFCLILALSALYVNNARLKQNNLKALLSLSLAAAIAAAVLVPNDKTIIVPEVRNAADYTLREIIEFFNLDKDELEQRRSFNMATYGWRSLYDAFGGPAYPLKREIMQVESSEDLYLRGSIRYTYNGRAWVDEGNSEKAGKIKRFMLTGLEGFVYKNEYEKAFDTDKDYALKYFDINTARVTMLDDNSYWAVYTPDRLTKISESGDYNLYYNNIGELFVSRQLKAGDEYTFESYVFSGDREEMRQAVVACKNRKDEAYSGAMLINRGLPENIDTRLYALVQSLTYGTNEPFDIACRICDYLRANGTYTLTPEYTPEGKDFVSYFVLDSMRGYCIYYASAMALMARIAGLPARYVEGYLYDADDSGSAVLTGEDAHAWCEVYFKGFGWVTFDATPPDIQTTDDNSGSDNTQGENTGNNDNGTESTPAPENTPLPTPAPTPTPTPALEIDQPENSPAATPAPTDDSSDDEQTESNTTPEPTPTDPIPEENKDNERNNSDAGSGNDNSRRVLTVLLLVLLIAALAFIVSRRLKLTNPVYAQKKCRTNADKLSLWYRACLNALYTSGAFYSNGETAQDFARRMYDSGLCSEAFISFSAAIEALSYADASKIEKTLSAARESYAYILKRMKLYKRPAWYIKRITKGLGDISILP